LVDDIFDLKTYKVNPAKIGPKRQRKFFRRFGAEAEEIFIKQ